MVKMKADEIGQKMGIDCTCCHQMMAAVQRRNISAMASYMVLSACNKGVKYILCCQKQIGMFPQKT
jgi:hypothetical protein